MPRLQGYFASSLTSFLFLVIVVTLTSSQAISQDRGSSKDRLDIVRSLLAESEILKEKLAENKWQMLNNSRDISNLDKELEKLSATRQLIQITRASEEAYRQAFVQEYNVRLTDFDTMNASIENLQTQLQLQQLNAAGMAVLSKRVECMQLAQQLLKNRRDLLIESTSYLEKLWEYTDVDRLADQESNREVLSLFNEIDEENTILLVVRGMLHCRVGNYEQAEFDLTRIIKTQGWSTPLAFAVRGCLYANQKQTRKSRDDIAAAKKIAEDDYFINYVLGRYYAESADWKQAELHFKKALATNKIAQPCHRSLALVLYEKSKTNPLHARNAWNKRLLRQSSTAKTG